MLYNQVKKKKKRWKEMNSFCFLWWKTKKKRINKQPFTYFFSCIKIISIFSLDEMQNFSEVWYILKFSR